MDSKIDASKKILGFKYQELVALLKCLDSSNISRIYLECFGDISDGSTTTEVKHSVDPLKELYDTHIDFWKTLNNLIDGYDEFRFYDSYILHTTAKIKKDSIFDGWKNLNSQERKNQVLSINPNKTINEYYKKVNACKTKTLENILEKFQIFANQPNAKEFYKEKLLNHSSITKSLKEKDREPFIISLFGVISFYLIENEDNKWEINLDSFDNSFQSYLKSYLIEDLIFPMSPLSIPKSTQLKYRFVEELKSIGYESKIGFAVKDFLKASESQMKMLTERPSLKDELNSYDDDILEEMEDEKLSQQDKLKYITNPDLDQHSKRFYDDCIDKIKTKTTIQGVKGVKQYYPKGRVHSQVEENDDFNWKLKKENES